MSTPRRDNFDDLPILAELRELLEQRFAGGRQAARSSRALRRSLRRPFRQVPVMVAVLVAVAVAVVALTVGGRGHVSGTHNPVGPGPGNLNHELAYIRTAAKKARQTPACRRGARAIPAVSQGAPSEALLSALGVLRRPGTPADRLPRYLQGNAPRGMYVSYVRRARVKSGISYYVVPVTVIAQGRTPQPASCYAAIQAAFQAELPQIPARLREPTKTRLEQLIAHDRRLAAAAAGEGVCLLFAGPTRDQPNGGTCGASAGEISERGLTSAYGWLSGVVPDGVATVTVNYPASHGARALTATSNVVGNVFVISVKPSRPGPLRPAMVWRSADGTIVKTLPAISGGDQTSAFCTSPTRSGCL